MEKYCPCCRDTSLQVTRVEGYPLEVWHCGTCEGIWLTETQLRDLLEMPEQQLKLPMGARKGSRACPECTRKMWRFDYPRTFVTIDLCTDCQGIWLDHREFQEINTVRTAVLRAGVKGRPPEVAKDSVKAWLLEFIDANLRIGGF